MLPFIAQRFYKAYVTKALFLLGITFIYFFTPLSVVSVAADYLNVASPAEISLNSEFSVSLTISAKPSASYYIKGRLGPATNQLNKGQTLDQTGNIWLSDSVNWTSFPIFKTDTNGDWSGKISLKAGSTATVGNNFLVVRIKNVDDNTTVDSSAYNLIIKPEEEEVQNVPTPQPVLSVGEPVLNEFMPNPPSGENEWVEIRNKGNSAADLSGWKVDDEPEKSTPQVIPNGTIVPAGGLLVVTFTSAKLNDLTDSVRLLKPDDSVVESYTYNGTQRGKSYAKDSSGNWFVSDTPTPNAANPDPKPAVVATKAQTAAPVTVNNTTAPTEEENSQTSFMQVKGISTSSANIATVAASSKIKSKINPLFSLPFIFLGLLLTAFGIIFWWKKKYGRPRVERPQDSLSVIN